MTSSWLKLLDCCLEDVGLVNSAFCFSTAVVFCYGMEGEIFYGVVLSFSLKWRNVLRYIQSGVTVSVSERELCAKILYKD